MFAYFPPLGQNSLPCLMKLIHRDYGNHRNKRDQEKWVILKGITEKSRESGRKARLRE